MASTSTIVVRRDPTDAEIARFLSTRTAAQMLQLVQGMSDPRAQATLTTRLLFAPPPPPDSGRMTTPEKAKKALNAFVGFRCYCVLIPAFKPWPMKTLSNPIGLLWEDNPNKPLWTLMTKAWSIIRDQIGKDKAPLDMFFRTMCPYLSIPPPETYLEHMGWKLVANAEGAPSLSREHTPDPDTLDVGVAATALSVEDIIKYCQSMGYAQEYIFDTNLTSSTFLGHTPSTAGGRGAARNKRRAKRQTARDPAFSTTLQQQQQQPAAQAEEDHFLGQLTNALTEFNANYVGDEFSEFVNWDVAF
ncbi:mating-type protein MAT alpha 1-domain-containing protein [Clohesyomyces aquaticus]|uniref:Mating-type protein MAT-1 n=1 Tax=Clohesyomyces aquaticus TaxID=1231657 RepID=A0A1Y1ZMP8_9PLEO|nr:mating-type protein MAT alpha 1-domain-containing protein [Clohesyomyces aquaticus]